MKRLIALSTAGLFFACGTVLAEDAGEAPAPEPAAQETTAPEAPATAPKTHTVVKKDCLWELAKTYYNNPHRWKVIYSANTDKIKDPHWIYPGQVFVIPDVPGPEIGEVGARPVETGVKIEAPVQAEAPAPPAAAPAPEPAPEQPLPKAEQGMSEDLSEEFPPGMTTGGPSAQRVMRPADWKADGKITALREGAAAQGAIVQGKLQKTLSASEGDRFAVYRRDSVRELDDDKEANYLSRIGTVAVRKVVGKSRYTFSILQSGDTVQPGDLLEKLAGKP